MIIKKIAELKSLGVWKDFSAAAEVEIAPRTLIFGFNGTGKTTLSRVLSSIAAGTLEERLPPNSKFKLVASDGASINQNNLLNPFGRNLLVFNSDYIKQNLH